MSKGSDYDYIIVESYVPEVNRGYHGEVHIKPVAGQEPYTEDMHVACSKVLSENYPIGTKFKIRAKITSNEGGKLFLYSHYSWPYEVLK